MRQFVIACAVAWASSASTAQAGCEDWYRCMFGGGICEGFHVDGCYGYGFCDTGTNCGCRCEPVYIGRRCYADVGSVTGHRCSGPARGCGCGSLTTCCVPTAATCCETVPTCCAPTAPGCCAPAR